MTMLPIAYLMLATLIATTATEMPSLRTYSNPLNGKAVDVFFVVDESSAMLNNMKHGQMKSVLITVMTELNPAGSSPYFGVFFYGALPSVIRTVPFPTTTAAAAKANLDLKQYITPVSPSSTLGTALSEVETVCQSQCRSGTARVLMLFTGAADLSVNAVMRRLENNLGMTVIIAGVGSGASTDTLNALASRPTDFYALPFAAFSEVVASMNYFFSWLISSVPRLLAVNSPLSVSSIVYGQYYTLQVNLQPYTTTQNAIVTFTFNCYNYNVYASLTQPNPTSLYSDRITYSHWHYPNSNNYAIYYLHVPKTATRLYLSFLTSTSHSSCGAQVNVVPVPTVMQNFA